MLVKWYLGGIVNWARPWVENDDDKGESYVADSFGVFTAVKRIVELLGNPHDWEKPIKFKVKQITKGDRSILTFEPVVK